MNELIWWTATLLGVAAGWGTAWLLFRWFEDHHATDARRWFWLCVLVVGGYLSNGLGGVVFVTIVWSAYTVCAVEYHRGWVTGGAR